MMYRYIRNPEWWIRENVFIRGANLHHSNMVTDKYFERMRETSARADTIIAHYVEGAHKPAAALPLRRIGRPRLRDNAVRLGYEISGGDDWHDVAPVCASYELLNCSTYVINWIFDKKNGDRSDAEVNDLIMAGFHLRELAERVLYDYGHVRLVASISRINEAVYEGQHLDMNVLRVGNARQFPTIDEFLKVYERRCMMLSGVFYGSALWAGSVVAKVPNENLYSIASRMGQDGQAANDLGDFAVPDPGITVIEKPYKDQLSDLRQGKLTLPLFLMLTRASSQDRMILEDMACESAPVAYEEVTRIMRSTGALDTCLTYLRTQHDAMKQSLYGLFPPSPARDAIAEMFVHTAHNKFIARLRKVVEGS